jgi:cell fate regulator YaaT (PSP1 superfamily)
MKQNVCYTRGCIIQQKENEFCGSEIHGCAKLDIYNYTEDFPISSFVPDVVEVRFKNTRKDFFRNSSKLLLKKGSIVAVEAQMGHDIGIVNSVGDMVYDQLQIKEVLPDTVQKKIYRFAKPSDIEKWHQAIMLEHSTMIRSRQITQLLKLNMKIGDVEYQGDKSKAIFYYIADERVDFRELIKFLAGEFRVKVEMKQIGARQEAGRIGGVGSCGRELCCSTWLGNFVSVSTTAARIQELTPNPQKLTGQCGKLKCCLNYELDVYNDARKHFPDTYETLHAFDTDLFCQKIDIFRAMFWYSKVKDASIGLIPLSVEQVKEIIQQNKNGVNPDISKYTMAEEKKTSDSPLDFTSGIEQDRADRFDKKRGKKKIRKKFGNNK